MKIILSGGGTGGHIYPAVAVAEALKRRLGDGVELLFVGAEGKMEMEKIPALGYEIKGLPVAGLHRRLDWRNLLLPFKVVRSLRLARKVVRDFGADVVVGFGGYASAPVLRAAQGMGIPTVIQEQNSYAGLTNKVLGKKARRICVAYDGMERFFPADRIVMTGNPLRGSFISSIPKKTDCVTEGSDAPSLRGAAGDAAIRDLHTEALNYFGFTADKPVLLVVGGSLGSRTFNDMMKRWVKHIVTETEAQVIWQTGKYYEKEIGEFMKSCVDNRLLRTARKDGEGASSLRGAVGDAAIRADKSNIWRGAFIDRMDLAYAAADLVISRSGAGTVSELCLLGKAVMFVPSPNVAEDHQTKNAMALVEKDAAEICPDGEAVERAIPAALQLIYDRERLATLSANIKKLGIPDSADRVAEIIISNG